MDHVPRRGSSPDDVVHECDHFLIGGIPVDVYGAQDVAPRTSSVAVLWIHHPRLSSAKDMAPLASHMLSAYASTPASSSLGLIVAAFDQRNHGARLHAARANQAWRDGNASHAQDMFSVFNGTMQDTRQLIEYLPTYVFPRGERTITHHLALGISLGGHAVWHCLLHEPRITAGVVVIGTPDYAALMYDRARLSRRASIARSGGTEFFGSDDFPSNLVESLCRYDPASIFLGSPLERQADFAAARDPSSEEQRRALASKLKARLGGKRIQILGGADDKLVPARFGTPFITWLKKAIGHPSMLGSSSMPGGSPSTAPGTAMSSAAPIATSLTTSSSDEWKAGAGSGWMASSSPGPESVPEKWHSAEWKAGAGTGWMVQGTSQATAENEGLPSRWQSAEWKAGAGSGWMVEHGADGGGGSGAAVGWAGDTNIVVEDMVFAGVKHEFPASMRAEATRFVVAALAEMARDVSEPAGRRERRDSRM